MKKSPLYLILVLVFMVSCKKEGESDPESKLLPQPLLFGDLADLIGMDTTNVRSNAPGQFFAETVKLGEPTISYKIIPSNIDMEVTLLLLFSFYENSLREIAIMDFGESDQMELAYNLSLRSQYEQWGKSIKNTLYYDAGYSDRVEFFNSPKELWDFVKKEDLSKYDIKLASVEKEGADRTLSLNYLGDDNDAFLGMIEPTETKKSTKNLEELLEKLKNKLRM